MLLPERKYEGLCLEESTGKKAQEEGRRPVESAVQPNPGRLSHAIPIRDPTAYIGAGLTTRRNQEALRQNLDTVVASSQGVTGSARTVMNDPPQAGGRSERRAIWTGYVQVLRFEVRMGHL